MRKQIFAALFVLIMLLSGCSGNTADPSEINSEVVTDTEVTAEIETDNSLLSSESMEAAAPEESESPESTAAPEATEPPKQESKPKDTTPAATAPEKPQSDPAPAQTTPAETEAPKETPKPAETQPEPTPEETKPKSAYDYPFDIDTIKADCIAIGQGMGLTLDTSLTTGNATSWNPVTASENTQGTTLKQNLESYIKFHTVENLGSYGIDSITSFNIYCEARGNGAYSIYFLFA